MTELYIKIGDTARAITDTLELPEGTPIDLSGASVKLLWREEGQTSPTEKSATITSAAAGEVSYQLVTDDVSAAKVVYFSWKIDFPDGSDLTVPSSYRHILHIRPKP